MSLKSWAPLERAGSIPALGTTQTRVLQGFTSFDQCDEFDRNTLKMAWLCPKLWLRQTNRNSLKLTPAKMSLESAPPWPLRIGRSAISYQDLYNSSQVAVGCGEVREDSA